LKETRQNVKDVKDAIVAANNHYRGYGAATVDIFRDNIDMEKISFENVNIEKINNKLELENRFNWKPPSKSKQTSLSDFI
jgi:hypothetical protein